MNPSQDDKKTLADKPAPTKMVVSPSQIKPGMKVVCSKDGQFGIVDHMQGPVTIKLNKDGSGVHHYIPLSWVVRVDESVHTDRPGEQAMREWSNEPPPKA